MQVSTLSVPYISHYFHCVGKLGMRAHFAHDYPRLRKPKLIGCQVLSSPFRDIDGRLRGQGPKRGAGGAKRWSAKG